MRYLRRVPFGIWASAILVLAVFISIPLLSRNQDSEQVVVPSATPTQTVEVTPTASASEKLVQSDNMPKPAATVRAGGNIPETSVGSFPTPDPTCQLQREALGGMALFTVFPSETSRFGDRTTTIGVEDDTVNIVQSGQTVEVLELSFTRFCDVKVRHIDTSTPPLVIAFGSFSHDPQIGFRGSFQECLLVGQQCKSIEETDPKSLGHWFLHTRSVIHTRE